MQNEIDEIVTGGKIDGIHVKVHIEKIIEESKEERKELRVVRRKRLQILGKTVDGTMVEKDILLDQ